MGGRETRALSRSLPQEDREIADVCKAEEGFSPGIEPAGTMVFELPASRTMRNACLLFKAPSLWYLVKAA